MVLDLFLRVSWVCFLLFSRAACFPTVIQVSDQFGDDRTSDTGGVGTSSFGGGGDGAGGFYGSSFLGGVPWVTAPVGGALSLDSQRWLPSESFPDFSGLYTYSVPLGMVAAPPIFPSSYIVQSGNGYQRGREALSFSKYSDDIVVPFPLTQYPGFS